MYGRHTFSAIGDKIFEAHNAYGLTSKVSATITDNASNFIKAFRIFEELLHEESDEIEMDDEDCDFVVIDDVLNNADPTEKYFLPSHKKCAAHTLNLVSKDMVKAIQRTQHSNCFNNAINKCSSLWNKTSRSCQTAETVYELAKVRLIVPTVTRWNSQFNAIKRVVEFDFDVLTNVFQKLKLNPITKEEISILKRFVDVGQPLSEALDVLQGEDNCYYGTLLPVLYTLKRKLTNIQNLDPEVDFADHVIKSIDERFANVLKDKYALIAAVSHPHFKNLFANNFDEKQMLRSLLLEEMKSIVNGRDNNEGHGTENFFDFTDNGSEDDNVESQLNNYFRFCKNVSELTETQQSSKYSLNITQRCRTQWPLRQQFFRVGLGRVLRFG